MRRASGWRLGWLAAVLLAGAGMAQAYTRAYLVNNTGEAVYSLHVKLTEPAKPGSAGSGQLAAIFSTATVSADGMTLDFSLPLDPAGIIDGQTVWIGWTDLDPQLSGEIASYYWGDAAGDMIGGVQTPPPGDTGAINPATNTNTGSNTAGTGSPGLNGTTFTDPGNNGAGGVTTQNNGSPTDPGFTPTDPNNSGNPTGPNNGGTTPPNNGGLPSGPAQVTATPEPATFTFIGGGIALLFASLSRRRRG